MFIFVAFLGLGVLRLQILMLEFGVLQLPCHSCRALGDVSTEATSTFRLLQATCIAACGMVSRSMSAVVVQACTARTRNRLSSGYRLVLGWALVVVVVGDFAAIALRHGKRITMPTALRVRNAQLSPCSLCMSLPAALGLHVSALKQNQKATREHKSSGR